MQDFDPNDLDIAVALYRAIDDPTARAVLDFLIDHPGQQFDGAAIAQTLKLTRHRDVARATFVFGETARELGRTRPWREAQLGYLMPAESAAVLRRARDQVGRSAGVV